jgi:hypothetical protein
MTSVFSEQLKYTKIRQKEYDVIGQKSLVFYCLTNTKSTLAAPALRISETFYEATKNRRSG